MEEVQTISKRKPLVWIAVGLVIALFCAGIWATREPAAPFDFLKKYEIAERRSSADGKLRILVLKADAGQIWSELQKEHMGKPMFSSSGMMNINGKATMYMSMGTSEGLVKVSNDLSFANEGFGMEIRNQEVKPGYCAFAYTRPKTIFDKAWDWVRGLFKTRSADPPQSPPGGTIRV